VVFLHTHRAYTEGLILSLSKDEARRWKEGTAVRTVLLPSCPDVARLPRA